VTQRAGERITAVGRTVGQLAAGQGHGRGLEIGTVQSATANVHPLFRANGSDRGHAKGGSLGRRHDRLDDGDVMTG